MNEVEQDRLDCCLLDICRLRAAQVYTFSASDIEINNRVLV